MKSPGSSTKADQDGPTTVRYSLLPHKQYDPVVAQRFGTECSQPLVAVPAQGAAPSAEPMVESGTPEVLVASIKPREDRKAWVVRLFNVSPRAAKTSLRWGPAAPSALWISNLAEQRVARVAGDVEIPASGVVTLRADLDR